MCAAEQLEMFCTANFAKRMREIKWQFDNKNDQFQALHETLDSGTETDDETGGNDEGNNNNKKKKI